MKQIAMALETPQAEDPVAPARLNARELDALMDVMAELLLELDGDLQTAMEDENEGKH